MLVLVVGKLVSNGIKVFVLEIKWKLIEKICFIFGDGFILLDFFFFKKNKRKFKIIMCIGMKYC